MEDNLTTEEEWNYRAAKALVETAEAIVTGEEKCIPSQDFLAKMAGPYFINIDK